MPTADDNDGSFFTSIIRQDLTAAGQSWTVMSLENYRLYLTLKLKEVVFSRPYGSNNKT
jgi:hypothetical protein